MSDGCGLANANFFLLSQEQLRWDTAPVAVQMRINGAKVSLCPRRRPSYSSNLLSRAFSSSIRMTLSLQQIAYRASRSGTRNRRSSILTTLGNP